MFMDCKVNHFRRTDQKKYKELRNDKKITFFLFVSKEMITFAVGLMNNRKNEESEST